jgi:GDP-D-mannose dehydratase
MKNKFWENKNVFITGVNGFVGGILASELLRNGANVYGLIRTLDPKSFLFYENINDHIRLLNGEITDKALLDNFFSENKIDVCFHLAAQVEVGVAAKHPFFTWETNIRGTYTLLESIRQVNPG